MTWSIVQGVNLMTLPLKNDNRNRQEVGQEIKQDKDVALERGHLLTLSFFLEIHIS